MTDDEKIFREILTEYDCPSVIQDILCAQARQMKARAVTAEVIRKTATYFKSVGWEKALFSSEEKN